MKSFKQLLNELTPQYDNNPRGFERDQEERDRSNRPGPSRFDIAKHQGERLLRIAGKMKSNPNPVKAARVSALARGIGLPLEAEKGRVQFAARSGENVRVSGGHVVEPGTHDLRQSDFGNFPKGLQGVHDSARRASALRRSERLGRTGVIRP